jgi:hypothetical protein
MNWPVLDLNGSLTFQVETFLGYTDAGSAFIYGYLGSKEKLPFDLNAFTNKSSVAYEVLEAINESRFSI